ncbi:MAG: hypothetical protein ACE148_12820 [Vicinamibacterales bacterium]
MSKSRLAFTVVSLILVVLELDMLFGGRHAQYRGGKPRAVGEFATGSLVSQTFAAPFDGIDSVTLFFWEPGRAPDTRIWLRLFRETAEGYTPVASSVVEPPPGARALVFKIPVQIHCKGHSFRVEAKALEPAPPLRAFSEGSVQPGTLDVDGIEQWGDLHIVVGAASRYRTLLASIAGPRLPIGGPWLHLLGLALANWALLRFAYGLTVEQ